MLGAAAITVAGVLVTAAVAYLGYRVNRRAERRLGLQAAMSAAELIAKESSDDTDLSAPSTALLALAGLGQIELAIALLKQLWPAGRVPNESAILVINVALLGRSVSAKRLAAEVLWQRSPDLDARAATDWPPAIDGRWPAEHRRQPRWLNTQPGPLTRLLLFDALIKMTLTQRVDKNTLSALGVRVYSVWETEHDARVKGLASRTLGVVLPAIRQLELDRLLHAERYVTMEQLEQAAHGASPRLTGQTPDPVARAMQPRLDQLQGWIKAGEPLSRFLVGDVSDRSQDAQAPVALPGVSSATGEA